MKSLFLRGSIQFIFISNYVSVSSFHLFTCSSFCKKKNIYFFLKSNLIFRFTNFLQPTLLIADLELTKTILNDLDNFPNRIKFGAERNITGENILFARDSKWKRLRQIVTPAFSPNKIRQMLPSIQDCVLDLIEALDSSEPIIDVKPYFSGFTLDTIARIAFGIKVSNLALTRRRMLSPKLCFNVAEFGKRSEKRIRQAWSKVLRLSRIQHTYGFTVSNICH